MKLIVLLPALNEEQTVATVIASIPKNIPGITSQEVIVVDDGSSDQTAAHATAAGAIVVSHGWNRGLGVAFQTGVDAALKRGADIVVTIDADGQFDPADIPALVKPVVGGRADVVTASRFLDPTMRPEMSWIKRWGNRRVAGLVSFLSGRKLADAACGFRAYSREALLNLNLFSRFTYTQETLLNLIFKGFRVQEIPVKVRGVREHGTSRVANNLWHYAFMTANTMFRTVLDYRPLRVFGWLGAMLFIAGLVCELFVLIHYIDTGMVTPYKTVGFTGGLLNLVGLGVGMIGLVADMVNRVRMTQERVLYFSKLHRYRETIVPSSQAK